MNHCRKVIFLWIVMVFSLTLSCRKEAEQSPGNPNELQAHPHESVIEDKEKTSIQLQEVYLTARKDDESVASSRSVEALFTDVISVYPVIKASVDNEEIYFSDFDSVRINGKIVPADKIKRWDSEEYGKIEFFWYEILSEKFSYKNNLSEGKIDRIEYKEVLAFSSMDWEQVLMGEIGTRRFKVEVKFGSQRISTPGKESRNKENLLPGIFRVSVRENKWGGDNVDYMTFFFNVPYIWGNSRNQAEHFVGIDCQDLVWFGLREAGLVPEARYDHHIHDIHKKKTIFDGYVMTDGRTIGVDSTEITVPIRRGDVVRFAEYGHYGAIYSDCSEKLILEGNSEIGLPNGELDNDDLVIHILFYKPRIEKLSTLIQRYNDNHIQIYRFMIKPEE